MKYTEQILKNAANEAYNKGDAKFDIKTEKCALIVIDLQNEFVKPEWTNSWVPEATRQIPKVKKVIEHCRTQKVPVIYTAFKKTHLFMDRPKTGVLMPLRNSHLGDNPEWFEKGEIWHEIKPKDDEIVIYKPSYGAFYDTALETILKNLNVDTIIICGTLTNFCCGLTARQGYERGFKVIFGSDISSTDCSDSHDAELRVLRRGFAKVLDSEKIIKSLN
jgi:nicotinamidase-related amidase